MKAKRTAFCAIAAALAAALLYISSVVPSGRLALAAIAGLASLAVVAEFGIKSALLSYAATSLLGFLLSPDKGNVAAYVAVFGLYPIIKSLLERRDNRVREWIFKLLYINVISVSAYLAVKEFFGISPELPAWYILLIAVNAVFVIYDFGLTKLATYYIRVLRKRGGS